MQAGYPTIIHENLSIIKRIDKKKTNTLAENASKSQQLFGGFGHKNLKEEAAVP